MEAELEIGRAPSEREDSMRRVFCILIAVLLLGTGAPMREARSTPVGISDREGMERIAQDPAGNYVLTADIDMGSEPWTPIPFFGTLDGAGHVIANLNVSDPGAETHETFDGNRKKYDTVFAGLFSTACNARIRDLTILNAKISVETDRCCFLGTLAGYASNAAFTGCTVETRSSVALTGVSVGVGGIAGFCEDCTFDGCSVKAELVFTDKNPDVLCEEYLGGVYAAGYATVKDCTVYTRGWAEIYGYAHNGGAVGMFKLPHGYRGHRFSLRDTSVDAEIRFFEVTPSRRAYCKSLIGENCADDCYLTHNHELHFAYEESAVPVPLRPEGCEMPVYRKEVREPLCTEWGYTTYTCETCGYSYRDEYVLPQHAYTISETEPTCTQEGLREYVCSLCGDRHAETLPAKGHVPGEWTVQKEPGNGTAGEEELRCTVCGAIMETRKIPALQSVLVREITLSETVLDLRPDDRVMLIVTVRPEDAADRSVQFESSDPGVASVDENGCVTAIAPGTATVFVSSTDGGASAFCFITVDETVVEEWIAVEPTAAPTPQQAVVGRHRCG